MKKTILLWMIALSALAFTQQHVVKIASFADRRSPWMKNMKKMARDIEKESKGRLKIIFYSGGIAGDDQQVVAKMTSGQLDGAILTGIGLGKICPEARILEAPFYFADEKQLDKAIEYFLPQLTGKFSEKGYTLMGWADQGFVHIMSKKRLVDPAHMAKIKAWGIPGDPVSDAVLHALNIKPVSLPLKKVMENLRSNAIDTVYVPPVAVVFLHWHNYLRYIVEIPVVAGSSALVINQKKYQNLPSDLQKLLRKKTKFYLQKTVKDTRKFNQKALLVLKKKGMKIVKLNSEQKKQFRHKGKIAAQKLVGKLYSAEYLKQLETLLDNRKD